MSRPTCPLCGREFRTVQNLAVHYYHARYHRDRKDWAERMPEAIR